MPVLPWRIASAPAVNRRPFAFWLGGAAAEAVPKPVQPPKGAYWHPAYWPDTPKPTKRRSRK